MTRFVSILTAVLLTAFVSGNTAAEPATDKPGVAIADLVKTSAVVEAVDLENRLVSLRGNAGNLIKLEVSEEARNLDQVEVGDIVEVEYYESVVLLVQDAVMDPVVETKSATTRTPKGDKPGIAAAETTDMAVTVEAIDYDTRMVTLKSPLGESITTQVGAGVTRFNEIKQGDEIKIRYTRAFAITVSEP